MKKFGYPRTCRITLKKEFEDIIKTGAKSGTRNWGIKYKQGTGTSGLAPIIPKKIFPRAVDRNRAKRILREAFRINRHKIKNGTRIAMFLRGKEGLKNFEEVEKEVLQLWRKAGVLDDGEKNS